jgi:hypothetical protein
VFVFINIFARPCFWLKSTPKNWLLAHASSWAQKHPNIWLFAHASSWARGAWLLHTNILPSLIARILISFDTHSYCHVVEWGPLGSGWAALRPVPVMARHGPQYHPLIGAAAGARHGPVAGTIRKLQLILLHCRMHTDAYIHVHIIASLCTCIVMA